MKKKIQEIKINIEETLNDAKEIVEDAKNNAEIIARVGAGTAFGVAVISTVLLAPNLLLADGTYFTFPFCNYD